MAAIPRITSSELLASILFAPQCLTTDLTDFGSTISLLHYKTFSVRFPEIRRLIALYPETEVHHTVVWRLRSAAIESPLTTMDTWDFLHNYFW